MGTQLASISMSACLGIAAASAVGWGDDSAGGGPSDAESMDGQVSPGDDAGGRTTRPWAHRATPEIRAAIPARPAEGTPARRPSGKPAP